MSALIRPAKTSDIKKIRTIIDSYVSGRRLLAKETVTLFESVQEFTVAEVDSEVVGCGALHVLWEDLAEVKPEALNDITQSIIRSYKAHFSDNELVDMLTFYNSEVGKKANAGLQLSEDEMKIKNEFSESVISKKISESSESLNSVLKSITQEWSTQLFLDVQAKLKAKGFTKQ